MALAMKIAMPVDRGPMNHGETGLAAIVREAVMAQLD